MRSCGQTSWDRQRYHSHSVLAQGSDGNLPGSRRRGEHGRLCSGLNVGLQMGQLKIGAPCRGENALNRLIRIEEEASTSGWTSASPGRGSDTRFHN